MYLTDNEIIRLHKKYAPSDKIFSLVYTHSQIIWKIASQIIETHSLQIDKELVRTGGLLHDIGVYKLYDAQGSSIEQFHIKHGIYGYDILKNEGYPEQICRFASCHTGVGLTVQDIKKQGHPLPPGDYCAETTEEKLIMYADKFHSKSNPPKSPRFNTAMWYEVYISQFGADKRHQFQNMVKDFGEPELKRFAAEYNQVLLDGATV